MARVAQRFGLQALLEAPERSRRVILLAFAIVLLSLGDLALTLVYATSAGLAEANPLARFIMGHNSPALLITWKAASVGFCIGVLVWARRSPVAEFGAWIGCAILTLLTFHWGTYASEGLGVMPADLELAMATDPRWIAID